MLLFRKLLAEPLLQFCIIGVCLYIVLHIFSSPSDNDNESMHINVTVPALANYLQYQNKSFNQASANSQLAKLSQKQREQLIEDFVRDEALYREALSLGLDQNDEIVRRRIIQKMEYVTQGFYNEIEALNETQLTNFYLKYKEDYRLPATATFTHVFFSSNSSELGSDIEKQAEQTLIKLNQTGVKFEEAGEFGQRYLYHRNYIRRSDDYIQSHFGMNFQQSLFRLDASNRWQGPLKSDHGLHLVLIRQVTESRIPALNEVANVVLADAQRLQLQQRQRDAVDKIIDKYTVTKPVSAKMD